MTNTPILGIPMVAPNQAAKEVTINDGFSIIERSLNSTGEVDMTAGDVTLTLADYQHFMNFHCFGHAAPRNLIVPASERFFMVFNDGTGIITVDPGAGASITVSVGSRVIILNDGTDLLKIADSALAGATISLDALSDVDLSTPATSKQILVYDLASTSWKADTRGRVEAYTTDATLALKDAYAYVQGNKATAMALTVPPNSTVAFPIGTEMIIENTGAGLVTITPGGGVTVNSEGPSLVFTAQWQAALLKKTATDVWTFRKFGGGGGGGSSGVDIESEGTPVTTATTIDFTGTGVVVTDDGGGHVTVDIDTGGGGGSAAGTWLDNGNIVIPAAANFTLITGAGATASKGDFASKGCWGKLTAAGSDHALALRRTIPSTPYTVEALVEVNLQDFYKFSQWGLFISDGTKYITAGLSANNGATRFSQTRFNPLGTYSADASVDARCMAWNVPMWIRMTDDGTNIQVFWSTDGENWIALTTAGSRTGSGFLSTPTHIGLSLHNIQPAITQDMYLNVYSYREF